MAQNAVASRADMAGSRSFAGEKKLPAESDVGGCATFVPFSVPKPSSLLGPVNNTKKEKKEKEKGGSCPKQI